MLNQMYFQQLVLHIHVTQASVNCCPWKDTGDTMSHDIFLHVFPSDASHTPPCGISYFYHFTSPSESSCGTNRSFRDTAALDVQGLGISSHQGIPTCSVDAWLC